VQLDVRPDLHEVGFGPKVALRAHNVSETDMQMLLPIALLLDCVATHHRVHQYS
jgi:hypothetical protein